MTTLLDILNEVEAAKQEAIDRVERNADPDWKTTALNVVAELAASRATFTTDDVWEHLDCTTHEPRALGAIMQKAHRLGLIQPTGAYTQSSRVACHGRPVRVWRSAC